MARSVVVAVILALMLAGAHAAAPTPEKPADDTVGFSLGGAASTTDLPADSGAQFGALSEVPDTVSSFDINTVQPLLPLIGQIPEKLLTEIALLVPKINVTWVQELLPYLGKADPNEVGALFRDLLPALDNVDPQVLARYVTIIGQINPKITYAIAPYLKSLDAASLAKLIPGIAALNPGLLVNAANLAAGLTPETWDALLTVVDLGVPAVNLAGGKIGLIPISVPAPPPFSQSKSWSLPSLGSLFGR